METIFTNHIPYKGPMSKYAKITDNSTILKKVQTQAINRPYKGLNGHIFKEDIQIAKKHKKRRSTSLINMERQIKTTIRHCLHMQGWAVFFF